MNLRPLHNNKKGQAVITDLFIAIGIFIVLITITSVLWNLYQIRLTNRLEYDALTVKAFTISDALLKTPGNPDNWDARIVDENFEDIDIAYPGLVVGELIVPYEKTFGLTLLTEDDLRTTFNAGQYRFGLRIRDATGQIDLYTIGKVSGSSKFSVNLARNIIYQSTLNGDYEPATVEVILSR